MKHFVKQTFRFYIIAKYPRGNKIILFLWRVAIGGKKSPPLKRMTAETDPTCKTSTQENSLYRLHKTFILLVFGQLTWRVEDTCFGEVLRTPHRATPCNYPKKFPSAWHSFLNVRVHMIKLRPFR